MRYAKIGLFFLLILLVGGMVNAQPEIKQSAVAPTIVENNDGSITVTIRLLNTGDEVAPPFLVEIQPLGSDESFFSVFGLFAAVIGKQKTCDSTHPDNVHRTITDFGPGEIVEVKLTTPRLLNDVYTIKGVSANECFGNVAVDPFGWGTNLGKITVTKGLTEVKCGGESPPVCSASENVINCPQDCGAFEGDGVCSSGETSPNEPACEVKVEGTVGDRDNDWFPDADIDINGDGISDKDICPDTPAINYQGKRLTPEENRQRYAPDSLIKGCPTIEISSVNVLGENQYNYGQRVPVIFYIQKDDNFDVTDLKIEAGIYETTAPILATFSAISPASVLGTRNLQEIETCRGEPFVQAANILELNSESFGVNKIKNDAAYILLPKANIPISASEQLAFVRKTKQFAIQTTAYKECGNALTSNALARVTLVPLPLTGVPNIKQHNIWLPPTCVTVSGAGADECTIDTITGTITAGVGVSGGGLAVCSKPNGALCSPTGAAGLLDNSGPSAECASGWCQDTRSLSGGICSPVGVLGNGDMQRGAKPSPICVQAGTTEGTFCDTLENLAFFDISPDKCTSGGIILFGGLFIIFLLFALLSGRKG